MFQSGNNIEEFNWIMPTLRIFIRFGCGEILTKTDIFGQRLWDILIDVASTVI